MDNTQREQKLNNIIANAKYDPDPKCEKCNGSGKVKERHDPNSMMTWQKLGYGPCLCIFVGDPDLRKIAVEALKKSIPLKH